MPRGLANLQRVAVGELPIAIVCAIFLSLGSYYAALALPLSKPDERFHYAYAEYVRDRHALPIIDLRTDSRALPPEQLEAHQPPLYYALVAGVSTINRSAKLSLRPNPHYLSTDRGNRNAYVVRSDAADAPASHRGFYTGRYLSLAAGLLALVFGYLAVRSFAPTWLAVAAASIMGFNPEFLYIGSSFSNDMLGAALATVGLWLLLDIWRRGFSPARAIWLGGVIGLATLAKLGGLGLLAPYAILVGWRAWEERNLRPVAFFALSLAAVGLVAGWWLWRNMVLYGDPFAITPLMFITKHHVPLTGGFLREMAAFAWNSYWLDFGPGAIGFADPRIYASMGLLAGAGVLGALGAGWRCKGIRGPLGLLASWLAVVVLGYVRFVSQNGLLGGGRLLFPAGISLAALITAGLATITGARARPMLPALASCGVLAFALAAIPGYLMPLAPNPLILDHLNAPPRHPSAADFEGSILLAGFDERKDSVARRFSVTYYWLPVQKVGLNFSVFLQEIVHSPDGQDEVISQVDTYPGYGASPTSSWQPGRYIVDTLELPLVTPKDKVRPDQQILVVSGIYDAETMHRSRVDAGNPETQLLYDQAVVLASIDPAELARQPSLTAGPASG